MVEYTLKSLVLGKLETNCYIISDNTTKSALIIDPASEDYEIISYITSRGLNIKAIVNTHGHADHIGANAAIKKYSKAPIMIHKLDSDFLSNPAFNGSVLLGEPFSSPVQDVLLTHGSEVKIDSMCFKVIHTPGHTPGGICLGFDDLLFTGDTLFCGSVGRWDLPGGDEKSLMNSLNLFRSMGPETKILPGHGRQCTIKGELIHNPFLNEAG